MTFEKRVAFHMFEVIFCSVQHTTVRYVSLEQRKSDLQLQQVYRYCRMLVLNV